MNTETNTSVRSLKIVGNTFPELSAGRIAINRAADRLEQLERELADLREQVAILRSDQNRLSEFTKTYRLRADEAEDQLAAERALADRLAGVLLSYDHDVLAGEDMQWLPEHDKSLAAWKEARNA
jgi:chromosome segregation ATPase